LKKKIETFEEKTIEKRKLICELRGLNFKDFADEKVFKSYDERSTIASIIQESPVMARALHFYSMNDLLLV